MLINDPQKTTTTYFCNQKSTIKLTRFKKI